MRDGLGFMFILGGLIFGTAAGVAGYEIRADKAKQELAKKEEELKEKSKEYWDLRVKHHDDLLQEKKEGWERTDRKVAEATQKFYEEAAKAGFGKFAVCPKTGKVKFEWREAFLPDVHKCPGTCKEK